jgi:cobalt-zinc-cadmium resistance protein CzcA
MERNINLEIMELEIEKINADGNLPPLFPHTRFNYKQGQLYSTEPGKYFEIVQPLGDPLEHVYQQKSVKTQHAAIEHELRLQKRRIAIKVKSTYISWIYMANKLAWLRERVAMEENYIDIMNKRYENGDITLLEKVEATAAHAGMESLMEEQVNDFIIAGTRLKQICDLEKDYLPFTDTLKIYALPPSADPSQRFSGKEWLKKYELEVEKRKIITRQQKAKFFPEIEVGFFSQEINHAGNFNGWQIGLGFPLYFLTPLNDIKKASVGEKIATKKVEKVQREIENNIDRLVLELNSKYARLKYFNEEGLPNAELLEYTAGLQLDKEDIGYEKYLELTATAFDIRMKYLETLHAYNQIALQLEFYIY